MDSIASEEERHTSTCGHRISSPSLGRVVCGYLMALQFLVYGAYGVEFSGGTGEPNNPFQITTAEQLIHIGRDPNLQTRCYILKADIDLNPAVSGGRVFSGPVIERFGQCGRGWCNQAVFFDGNNHVIRNLTISIPFINIEGNESGAGLIGTLENGASVVNLHFQKAHIAVVGMDVGCLIGWNKGTVTNCSVDANSTVIAQYRSHCAGGIVGINYRGGEVRQCSSSATIAKETTSGSEAGGLVGRNEGAILQSAGNGRVYGSQYAGGLVGYNRGGSIRSSHAEQVHVFGDIAGGLLGADDPNSSITLCHAAPSAIEADGPAGGLAGECYGLIENSYALINPQNTEGDFGGLVGTLGTKGRIRRCYALGNLAATYSPDSTVVQSYYLQSFDANEAGVGIALTESEMVDANSFVGFDFYGTLRDGWEGHWYAIGEGYPILTCQTDVTGLVAIPDLKQRTADEARQQLEAAGLHLGDTDYDYCGQMPEQRGPYIRHITVAGLSIVDVNQIICALSSDAYAYPGTSVDVLISQGPYDWSKNSGDGSGSNPYRIETAGQFSAISAELDDCYQLSNDIDLRGWESIRVAISDSFSGVLDGNNHCIKNLIIDAGSQPLLAELAYDGVLRDLTFTNICVTGEDDVTGIVGVNKGIIANVHVSAILWGHDYVAGLAVTNDESGLICNVDVTSLLYSSYCSGGCVGKNYGLLVNVSCTTSIRGGDYIGGVVGCNHASGIVMNSGAVATIDGTSFLGGIAGHNLGLLFDCIADLTVSGLTRMGGIVGWDEGRNVGCEAVVTNEGDACVGVLAGNECRHIR